MSGKQFSQEDWEAAMAAQRQKQSHVASSSSSHEDTPPPGMTKSMATWFKRTFPVDNLPVDPSIREELPHRQRGQTVDLNSFCQGMVGEADQRYLRQQDHAYAMSRDPNVEVYRDTMAAAHTHRRKGYFVEDEEENRGSAAFSRPLTLFQWLRLFLLAALATCAILFVSFQWLPSSEGSSMTSIVWCSQVFCVNAVVAYLALSTR